MPLLPTSLLATRICKRLYASLVALCLVCPVGAVRAQQEPSADWPQFLGPMRNGMYYGDDIPATFSAAGPRIVWKKQIGEGFAGPVVADQRVILFHRRGNQEVIDCFDADTAELLWSFPYATTYRDDFGFDEGPRATPTVADGRVYTFGAQGVLHCLDFATGKRLWRADTHRRFAVRKGFFGAACSPLIEAGRVLVNVGSRDGAGIVAFDAADGKVLWKATDQEASYSSPTAATIAGRRHALFLTRAGLVGIDPADGGVRFQFRWGPTGNSVSAATPLAIGDRIFLSTSYQTGAILLEVAGGKLDEIWRTDESLTNHYATSVYHDGHLYGYHGRQEFGPSLRCIELATGKVRWSEDRFGAGTVLLAGDHLLALNENGMLQIAGASPEGFRPTARASLLPGTVRAYPALAQGHIYARNQNTLICMDLRKGEKRRRSSGIHADAGTRIATAASER